ncbi:MULE transposase domain [Nesidiocoris tenuis]|uniref:MULE transposase domain n=1 Tax=Nesidiocoris tenuis TaxID=355587 RepID=A0ABN7AG73_9HEMI|nr:MULE transposase domain [Nesidiocoris tenuis]
MKKHWSKPFLSYFDKHILTDLKSTAKWELEKRDVYLQGSGITTNRAESFNAVIKRLIDYNEVKGQVTVLTLYHLDICYRKDIVRGKCRQGNFVLVDPYLGFALSVDEVDFPESRINLDNLPYVLTNRDLQLPQPEPE